MKPQFSIYSIFLVVTFLAIGLGGILAQVNYVDRIAGTGLLIGFFSVPMWIPFIFAGFVVGRRAIGINTVLALALVEGAILLAFNVLLPSLYP